MLTPVINRASMSVCTSQQPAASGLGPVHHQCSWLRGGQSLVIPLGQAPWHLIRLTLLYSLACSRCSPLDYSCLLRSCCMRILVITY